MKKWKHSKEFRSFLARRLLAENGCESGASSFPGRGNVPQSCF